MARIVPLRRTLQEELRDSEFAAEYAAELQRLQIAHQIAEARKSEGLTQAQLAEKVGTAQPTVARLERGEYRGYTTRTLAKIAHALHRRLRIELEPISRRPAYAKKMLVRKAKKK